MNYHLFLLSLEKSKCATYIRKDLGRAPRIKAKYSDYFLSAIVDINHILTEFITGYVQSMRERGKFSPTHKRLTNALVAGDFNTNRAMWYGEAAIERHDSIRNSVTAV